MPPTLYGYARVSSHEQNEERQRIALLEHGIRECEIFSDKQSGKDFDRPQYKRMLRRLRKGDILVIKSIDRLGRNYHEILTQWRILTKEKCVKIKVLDMPLLDTATHKDLMGTFIADLVLQLLSFVAENERDNILMRQKEGIAVAKANGVQFGRPRVILPDNFDDISRYWRQGKLTGTTAANLTGLSRSTFLRYARKQMKQSEDLHIDLMHSLQI